MQTFRENVIRILGSYLADGEPGKYDEQLDGLQNELMRIIKESVKLDNADDEFNRQYRKIAD